LRHRPFHAVPAHFEFPLWSHRGRISSTAAASATPCERLVLDEATERISAIGNRRALAEPECGRH
jgi:hypothetical protein